MEEARHEFTRLTRLQAEALGQPGRRTFRILADSGSSSAVIWLEKEQLFQLAMMINQLLAASAEEEVEQQEPPYEREAPALTHLEFKAGRMAMGYDPETGLFTVEAQEDEEGPAAVRLWIKREMAREFAEEALRVCAAGRPICPLCGGPIDPTGHFCPRVNGHRKAQDL